MKRTPDIAGTRRALVAIVALLQRVVIAGVVIAAFVMLTRRLP